ncbi:MAG: 50S ribosomal protein L5 [bacterium]|nr:50S ribosomal protein L5 [bacterium]
MAKLFQQYKETVVPALMKQFSFGNLHQVPQISKITLNIGLGRVAKDPAFIETAESSLSAISGQKPVRNKAKKSIAGFKIRQGMVVGMSVTLRKARMYDFLDKLVSMTLPRVRDFRGIDKKYVDAHGNMSIGFKENAAFPEIRSDELERLHGLEVTITTTAHNKEEGLALFTALGFPFKE